MKRGQREERYKREWNSKKRNNGNYRKSAAAKYHLCVAFPFVYAHNCYWYIYQNEIKTWQS